MGLFHRIPENFFSILASPKRELYVESLFVLRQAFKSELTISVSELAAMLMDSLENSMMQSDFTEEAEELVIEKEMGTSLSGKAYLLIRKLKAAGWIDVEYAEHSFEENITIPDYAIRTMQLLYDLSVDEKREYNSYVFATYSALKNAGENPDYYYQALLAAYNNTVRLEDELKSLFNNVKRHCQIIANELSVNELLAEHFDQYKEQIVDPIYYPLKTIDSVPRFKHAIISILNEWLLDAEIVNLMIAQGKQRHIYENDEIGQEDIIEKINYIVDTFENIENMISSIDQKHTDYIRSSIDHIRYMINADRSVKGKLVELLKRSGHPDTLVHMRNGIEVYQHSYLDSGSLYDRVRRTIKTEGRPLRIENLEDDDGQIMGFLSEVRKQYSSKRIDDFIEGCFCSRERFRAADIELKSQEDFILLLLGTIRAGSRGAGYRVEFQDGAIENHGYRLPDVCFIRRAGA